MSLSKKDLSFPSRIFAMTDRQLALLIANALRDDFDNVPSAVKEIGLQTGINPRAIKNWFQAKNTPSAANLLILARVSPAVLQIVTEQIRSNGKKLSRNGSKNAPVNAPVNQSLANHNRRQAWFLRTLMSGGKASAREIQAQFGINLKTAKRDIAALKKEGIITFVGARKNGYYTLT